jgi:hypothetical protein
MCLHPFDIMANFVLKYKCEEPIYEVEMLRQIEEPKVREVRTYTNLAYGHPAGFEFVCVGFRPDDGQQWHICNEPCCVACIIPRGEFSRRNACCRKPQTGLGDFPLHLYRTMASRVYRHP